MVKCGVLFEVRAEFLSTVYMSCSSKRYMRHSRAWFRKVTGGPELNFSLELAPLSPDSTNLMGIEQTNTVAKVIQASNKVIIRDNPLPRTLHSFLICLSVFHSYVLNTQWRPCLTYSNNKTVFITKFSLRRLSHSTSHIFSSSVLFPNRISLLVT
jgi:hypothetical protein